MLENTLNELLIKTCSMEKEIPIEIKKCFKKNFEYALTLLQDFLKNRNDFNEIKRYLELLNGLRKMEEALRNLYVSQKNILMPKHQILFDKFLKFKGEEDDKRFIKNLFDEFLEPFARAKAIIKNRNKYFFIYIKCGFFIEDEKSIIFVLDQESNIKIKEDKNVILMYFNNLDELINKFFEYVNSVISNQNFSGILFLFFLTNLEKPTDDGEEVDDELPLVA